MKLYEILVNWPKSYISGTDLHYILNKSPASRQGIVKRGIQKGYLVPIRRDLYLIQGLNKPLLDAFEIAPIIYGPSYISFESALSYHGWIPEAVRTITSATVKRSKEFEGPLGIFSYEHIPIKAFSFAVEQHQKGGVVLFIASAIKALADMIYVKDRNWGSLTNLCEDLRIEIESFQNIHEESLSILIENYPSLRVKKSLKMILGAL